MRKFIVAGVFVAMLAAVGGVAYASIPDSAGVIHGCYKTGNPAKGAVTVIDTDAGETCPSGTAPLNWNQTGPQGPAGPAGVSGLQYVQAVSVINSDQLKTVSVSCPSGKIVISGGGFTGGGFTVLRDSFAQYPVGDSPGNTWTVTAYKPVVDESSWGVVVQAICANAP